MSALLVPANVVRWRAIRAKGNATEHRSEAVARRKAGKNGRVEQADYYTTSVAADAAGVSVHMWRKLTSDIEPAAAYQTNAHGKHQICALWSREQVTDVRSGGK